MSLQIKRIRWGQATKCDLQSSPQCSPQPASAMATSDATGLQTQDISPGAVMASIGEDGSSGGEQAIYPPALPPRVPGKARKAYPPGPSGNYWRRRRGLLLAYIQKGEQWLEEARVAPGLSLGALAKRLQTSVSSVATRLSFARLAPAIREDLADQSSCGPAPTFRQLRLIAAMKTEEEQVRSYGEFCKEASVKRGKKGWKQNRKSMAFAQAFAQAKRLQRFIEANSFSSMTELCQASSLPPYTCRRLLDLLLLPPEIVARVMVPVEELPQGVTLKGLRALSRILDPQAQWEAFQQMVGCDCADLIPRQPADLGPTRPLAPDTAADDRP